MCLKALEGYCKEIVPVRWKMDVATVLDLERKIDDSLGAAHNRVETKVDSIVNTLNKNATSLLQFKNVWKGL